MIYQLISECTDYDFKREAEWNKLKSWLKSISAFANTLGGTLFFGITDDKEIVGVTDSKQLSDKISESINARIKPTPVYTLTPYIENGKTVLAVKVFRGTTTPYYYVGDGVQEAYIRSGNESIIAPTHILNELILKGSNQTYDAIGTRLLKSDYSFSFLEATFYDRTKTRLTESDYRSFNLCDKDYFLTNAGALLADQNIYTHSRIFCTRWNGITKTSIHGEATDDKEISGCLLQQLYSALDFVRNNTKKKWHKQGLYRVEQPEYDEEAIREALVNAIVHREYTRLGAEVCVDIYEDRLEVTSPGCMFSGQAITKEVTGFIASERRNPHIADLFARMDFMERRGSGLKKITDRTNQLFEDNKNHVEFYSDNSYFKVTIYNANYGMVSSNDTENDTNDTVSDTEKKVYDLIRESNRITVTELMDKLQKSRPTVLRALAGLKEKKLIAREGSNRSGRWIIL